MLVVFIASIGLLVSVVAGGFLFVRYVLIGALPKLMAVKDDFFTPNPPEGEIVIIESGGNEKNKGKVELFLANIRDHMIDTKSGELKNDPAAYQDSQKGSKAWFSKVSGTVFIGGSPGVFHRKIVKFDYLQYYFDGQTADPHQFTARTQEQPSLPYQMTIGVIASNLQTLGKEEVRMRITVTFVIRNAYKALYMANPDHTTVLSECIIAFTREYVSKHLIGDLMSKEFEQEKDGFIREMIRFVNTDDGANPGITSLAGIEIVAAKFISVDPWGDYAKQIGGAIQAAELQEQEGKGRIAKAKEDAQKAVYEAQITETKGKAQANVEKAFAEARSSVGPNGIALTLAESVAKLTGTFVLGSEHPLSLLIGRGASQGNKLGSEAPASESDQTKGGTQ